MPRFAVQLPLSGLQALTIVNPSISDELYLGQEFPPSILEFSLSSNSLTGRQWLLEDLPAAPGAGLSGLTFAQMNNSFAPGLFFACSSLTGQIFGFAVDLFNASVPVERVVNVSSPWQSDCTGMHYEQSLNLIFAVSKAAKELAIFTPAGALVDVGPLPHAHQNGITMRMSSAGKQEVFVADAKSVDDSHIWRFVYPIPKSCF